MVSKTLGRAFWIALFGAAALAVAMPWTARAESIMLKDGHVLRGQVQREGTILVDNGTPLWSPKLGGFFIVDDHVRRIIFSPKLFVEALQEPPSGPQEAFHPRQVLAVHPESRAIVKILGMDRPSPWNNEGRRMLTVTTDSDEVRLEQCLVAITPNFLRASTKYYRWTCSLLTSEVDPGVLLEIIRQHQKRTASQADQELKQRLAVIRFCIQARWYEQAASEIQKTREDFPDDPTSLDEVQQDLRRLVATHRLEEIELAIATGQQEYAQRLLQEFPRDGAPAAALTKVQLLRQDYQQRNATLASTRQHLQALAQDPKATVFEEALAEIARNLNLDTYPRLEPFLDLAVQEQNVNAVARLICSPISSQR